MSAPCWVRKLKYRGVLPVLGLLPLRWGYGLVSRLGRWFFYRFEREWVSRYRTGLSRVFAEADAAQLDAWTARHFEMMAREELDVVHLRRMRVDNFEQWGRLEVADALGTEGGKIVMIGHAGRTILLSRLGLAGVRCGVLTMAVEGSPHLDGFLQRYLLRKMQAAMRIMGGTWLTDQDSFRGLFRVLREGGAMVIASDLAATRGERALEVPFLGGHLRVSAGVVRLAERTGAQIFYGRVVEGEPGQASIELVRLSEVPEVAFFEGFRLLEADVEQAPWLWWQWNQLDEVWVEGE